MAIAVVEYWMAMTLASWLKTYFVIQLFGVVKLYVLDFGGRDLFSFGRGDICH